MFAAAINLHDNLPNQSEQNSCIMDDLLNDFEGGTIYNPPRHINKKMKTRKQLDALLKFRSSTSRSSRNSHRSSNEMLLSSEDELFLPPTKNSPNKL